MKFDVFSYYNKQMGCFTTNLLMQEENSVMQVTGVKRAFGAKLAADDAHDFVGMKLVKLGTFDDETGFIVPCDPQVTILDFDYAISHYNKGKAAIKNE